MGMTIIKHSNGYEISMDSYIEDVLKMYGERVKEFMTPAKQQLFVVNRNAKPLVEKEKFHSIVAKLLYLGKGSRPDILLPVQFLCTHVKSPTINDKTKLDRVLGYLKITKHWTHTFDDSAFDRVVTYIDASFATQMARVSQLVSLH